jgi:hypothetical protein
MGGDQRVRIAVHRLIGQLKIVWLERAIAARASMHQRVSDHLEDDGCKRHD